MSSGSFNVRHESVADALRDLLEPVDGIATAFLAGSLVEGHGNGSSDIDLIVVTDSSFVADKSPVAGETDYFAFGDHQILISDLDGRRVDVEFRARADVGYLADRLRAPRLRDDVFEGALDQGWLEFLHDLRIGVPLVAAEQYDALKGSIDWGALGTLLVDRYEHVSNGHLEDAAGAIEAKDAGLALLTSRASLQAAVDAYLASRGVTNPKPKWRFRKLHAPEFEEVRTRYLELEIDLSYRDDDLLAQARRRVTFAQDLLLDARSG